MSNSPNKLLGGILGKGIMAGLGASIFKRQPRPRQRIKDLEQRVSALEGGGDESQAATAVQENVQDMSAEAPGVSQLVGAAPQGTALANNNALSSNPMRGLENMQNKIAAPGPLSEPSEELSKLFNSINY